MIIHTPVFPTTQIARARNHILSIVPSGKKNEITALLISLQNSIIQELNQGKPNAASNV